MNITFTINVKNKIVHFVVDCKLKQLNCYLKTCQYNAANADADKIDVIARCAAPILSLHLYIYELIVPVYPE